MITSTQISEINRNWKIKVNGTFEGKKINTLVGVSGLVRFIGEDMAKIIFEKADQSLEDKFTKKLRRGLRISLYAF